MEESLPGVSILKPLCSADDPNLFQNLETFFTLKYPKFEILFCLQDDVGNRLLHLVQSLQKKFPSISCQYFCGGEPVGINPKVNNLNPAFNASTQDLILISDSGIRMREDTLCDMVSCMTSDIGVVSQLPFACDRTGIPGILEKVFFGTSLARNYLALNFFGVNTVTGMSVLMRKDVLEEAGGMQAYGSYLAEDYFMARTFQERGYKLDISSYPALQNPGDSSISNFHCRVTRWAKLRHSMCPHLIILEPLSECIVIAALCAWAGYFLFRLDALCLFLVHTLMWFLMDWALIHVVQNGPLPFNKFEFLVMWIFRELSPPYIYLIAHLKSTINWRSHEFRLYWGGRAENVSSKLSEKEGVTKL